MNKQIDLLTMFVVLLNSCAPNAALNVTATPLATIASTSTPVLTATPTITPTPTNTPDPNMPADAMRKDANENWIKPAVDASGKPLLDEHNNPIYDIWETIHFVGDPENVTGHWFAPHVINGSLNGGIPLHLSGDDPYGYPDMIPMFINFIDGMIGPYFEHPAAPGKGAGASFTGFLNTEIGKRYWQDTYGTNETNNTLPETLTKMENGELSIPFDGPAGSFVFKPGDKGGLIVNVLNDWDAVDPAKDPRFMEWSYYDPNGAKFRSMTIGNNSGDTVVYIVSQKPISTLTTDEIDTMILFAFARVIMNHDQSLKYFIDNQQISHEIRSFVENAKLGSF